MSNWWVLTRPNGWLPQRYSGGLAPEDYGDTRNALRNTIAGQYEFKVANMPEDGSLTDSKIDNACGSEFPPQKPKLGRILGLSDKTGQPHRG
jgi:hypothetical protein